MFQEFINSLDWMAWLLAKAFGYVLKPAWLVFKNWWWVVLPFWLWKHFKHFYLWWRNIVWAATWKNALLEIKIPVELLKPTKAMDEVFAGLHTLHDVINWREKWIEGQFQPSISLEIISTEGAVHFYMRMPKNFVKTAQSVIYSQYPQAEIFEVEDYTQKIPKDIPNEEWDVFGFDMINTKPNPYPIKTYPFFEAPSNLEEEERVDPIATLLEGLAAIGPGEHLWLQIVATPIREEVPWVKEGREIVDKLVKRPDKPKSKPILSEALNFIITGKVSEAKEEKENLLPPEMQLTMGEREIVFGIENKIKKFGYNSNIRWLYIGKKEVFVRSVARVILSFFKQVSFEGLGGVKPWKVTMIKSKSVFTWFLDRRKMYIRKKNLFARYVRRVPPLFPMPGGRFILNSEELATLFHFPSRIAAPVPMERIETKKGEPPANLPV